MTKAARTVLADCEEALADLTEGVQGSAWRMLLRVQLATFWKVSTGS